MKRKKTLWIILGVVLLWTFFLVPMGEARPANVRFHRHGFIKKSRISSQWRGRFRHGFTRELSIGDKQADSKPSGDLPIRGYFWEMLFTIAKPQQGLIVAHENSKSGLWEAYSGKYRSEQFERLRKRKATAKLWFRLRAGLRRLFPVPKIPKFKELPLSPTENSTTSPIVQQVQPNLVVHEGIFLSPRKHLYQLHILRI